MDQGKIIYIFIYKKRDDVGKLDKMLIMVVCPDEGCVGSFCAALATPL